MATVAGSANGDVLDGSGQSAARVILGMARCTLPRGSLEYLIQMAGLAAHRLMRAAQLKTGTGMVKCNA